jgi:SagB-type dehydrogenase family enzyme
LPPGIYQYDCLTHKLVSLIDGDMRRQLYRAALDQSSILQAGAVFALLAVYERVSAKYGPRGVRYAHMENGHAAQNLLLQSVALGLGAVPIGAFDDAQVKRILRLSEQEVPLYLIPVGHP